MASAHCAICRRLLAADAPKPFCSDGCRRVDLARWLGGEYAFAAADPNDHAGLHAHVAADGLGDGFQSESESPRSSKGSRS